jgi:hypothetical protein
MTSARGRVVAKYPYMATAYFLRPRDRIHDFLIQFTPACDSVEKIEAIASV